MSKKKIEDFMKASQNYFVIGEVKAVNIEEKESKSGGTYYKYSTRIKTPEGITIFVNKNRFPATEDKPESDFVKGRFESLEELAEMDLEKEKVFVRTSAKKQDGKPMYNWFTNYENDEGKVSYNIDGFMFKVDSVEDEQGTVIKFEKYSERFENMETKFNVRMYVKDIVGNKLYLTDGKEEYSNDLLVEVPEDMENKAEIGQGYDFRIKLVKGKRHKVESGTANWGEGNADVSYDPDKCVIDAVVGVVKDMKISGATTKRKSATTKTADPLDKAPF